MSASRELDIVLFGATGVTGTYVLQELHRSCEGLRWGVAGRDADKLRRTLRTAASDLDLKEDALDRVPIIVANVEDNASLLAMAQRTRLVLNTVGPYRFFGRPVVAACVNSGTHHIDVSAEVQYMEQMLLEFYDEARKKNTLVLMACGFGSVPAEMCLCFMRENFRGDLEEVESYMKIKQGPLVQVQTYFCVPGVLKGIGLALLALVFLLFSWCRCGRWLLMRFPGIFTAGCVKRGGHSKEQALGCSFTLTARGRGWKEKLAHPGDHPKGRMDHSVTIRMEGPGTKHVQLRHAAELDIERHMSSVPSANTTSGPSSDFMHPLTEFEGTEVPENAPGDKVKKKIDRCSLTTQTTITSQMIRRVMTSTKSSHRKCQTMTKNNAELKAQIAKLNREVAEVNLLSKRANAAVLQVKLFAVVVCCFVSKQLQSVFY
ncbi:saccharopine dehydrogenase-like oxidoreductase isoform X3 [Rhipicephalus microplus]|uniref:saccharopine dehydrogenase-like oxidoreductase isoform X3 n=1 Tax=Rhipicephalus microplus TaxID=6941 RepID=UPI003F6C40C2